MNSALGLFYSDLVYKPGVKFYQSLKYAKRSLYIQLLTKNILNIAKDGSKMIQAGTGLIPVVVWGWLRCPLLEIFH
jgi:hypothetical protein